MTNANFILITMASVLAIAAIYLLYVIILYKEKRKETELELTTKNVLEQVKILYEKKEYALVELLATKYLERVPGHKDVRVYLAKAYYKNKKYNNSIKQCLIILKRESNNIEIKKLLGKCYEKKELPIKAIKEYEDIFDSCNNDKDVIRSLAELYRNTEQIYSSIQVYEILAGLLTNNDEIAEVQLTLAELNEESKNYPAAFQAYKNRLEIYPTDISTNQKLIELYIRIKNYTKAIETLLYMATFVKEPKILLWVYENLVTLYKETEEYTKAIEFSEKMLEIQGADKFKIRSDIANFNIKLNNYDTGISILEELSMMSENDYETTMELAKSYILNNMYQEALDKYLILLDKANQKEAKEIRLQICNLYIQWAISESEGENYHKSYQYLDSAEQYNAINPEIYYNIANNKMKQKLTTEAVEYLSRALEFDKTKEFHPKYLLTLAEAHHDLGNFFEEKKALTDLLKIDENNANGLYRTGMMYIAQHDTKAAEEYLQKALSIDSNLLAAKYNLALIYENNNRDKAKELYIELLEQDPSFEDAKNALADLTTSDY